MLSDVEIEAAHASGDLQIDPFHRDCLRSSSYLLRIGPKLLVANDEPGVFDTRGTDGASHFTAVEMPDRGFDLEPGRFYLGGSVEKIGMSNSLAGWLSQLSSMARAGLSVNFSSNLIAATFGLLEPGAITFEMINFARWPIRIYPHVKFCHLAVIRHAQGARMTYPGIYGAASGPIASNFLRKPSR
jgi:deoxycytidine triphosphate deaminase